MVDREKVIRGLECCLKTIDNEPCPKNCPYLDKCLEGIESIFKPMISDALALLKKYAYGTRYVPVVRCYECQHWEPENAEEFATSGHCRKPYWMSEGATTDSTWFCSDGEREG